MDRLAKPREVNITGYLLAIALAPVVVTIDGREFLAIFSTEAKLRESMRFHKVEDYTIQKISNGREFLECLWAQDVQVALDPHPHEGNTRFALVTPNTQREGNA